MGKQDGFLLFDRELPEERTPTDRLADHKEIYADFAVEKTREQSARCMDCGVPFCNHGCPLGNNIPEFNDAVYNDDWNLAIQILEDTNNFPEFTGRICPAPCEGSCVLGINKPQVAIEHIEKTIAEKAYELGYYVPKPPLSRSGKRIAIVGSGPAGLAAADELNKLGHSVTVYERDEEIGGLLRFGIPDFKLEKWVVERRIELLRSEGINFQTNSNVGVNIDVNELLDSVDALVLCGGSTIPRDLDIRGRDLKGIHFAMDFLTQQNRVNNGSDISGEILSAKNKRVIVLGGGDTGSDCVGTSNRQGATSVTQFELLPKPPNSRSDSNPWPEWPMILRTSSSHKEGAERKWAILTKEFVGDGEGKISALKLTDIDWVQEKGKMKFKKREESTRLIPCDLVLLAMGFIHPQKEGLLEKLNIELDDVGNVRADDYSTSVEKIFTAGDMRRGQSLVVWAIAEGREAANRVDQYLRKPHE